MRVSSSLNFKELAVLGRLFLCARCSCQVFICRSCDRGQCYCAGECSRLARQSKMREAGKRYQGSYKGSLRHAARALVYRKKRNRNKVTHQGSADRGASDLLCCDTVSSSQKPARTCHFGGHEQCHWCGQQVRRVSLGRYRVVKPVKQPQRN